MKKTPALLTLFLLCNLGAACSASSDSPPDTTTAASTAGLGGGASSSMTARTAGNGGTATTGSGGTATTGGGAGAGGSGGAASTPATGAAGTTQLSGTLGDLGPVQPTVSSIVISNSGETLIYMSSAPITCDLASTSRWLGSVAAGSQVVEIVVPSTTTTGELAVQDGAEVNYAPGGKSSAYEKNAASGSVTFTTNTPKGAVEGTVTATYSNPAGNVSGSFHAEFCAGGQGY